MITKPDIFPDKFDSKYDIIGQVVALWLNNNEPYSFVITLN
jgi:hypothetical protein